MRISTDAAVQAEYEAIRALGESHHIAEMLALRKVPGSQTDREYLGRRKTLADQFQGEEHMLELAARKAAAQGITLNYQSVYEPALADEPMDPKAFVPPTHSRSYIKDLLRERNLPCEDWVKNKPVQREGE